MILKYPTDLQSPWGILFHNDIFSILKTKTFQSHLLHKLGDFFKYLKFMYRLKSMYLW